jgi:hypothetical protein
VSLGLSPTPEQRVALLTSLHTREGAAGTTRTDLGGLLLGLGGRILRRPGA